jgi:uncharacterized protein
MREIIGAYIEITGICNRNCPYCYNAENVRLAETMPWEIVDSLLGQLHRDFGLRGVALSGGEPFLHTDIEKILFCCKEHNVDAAIVSNGVCFEDGNLELLLKYQPNIQITLDGASSAAHDLTRGDGNFEQLVSGVKKARLFGYRGRITVRLNLHKGNYGELRSILTAVEDRFSNVAGECLVNNVSPAVLHKSENYYGAFDDFMSADVIRGDADFFSLVKEWNSGRSPRIEQDFELPDIGCPYNEAESKVKCGLRISVDGTVFPCQQFSSTKFALGNVRSETLSSILTGRRMTEFVEAVHTRKFTLEKCRKCAYSFVCSGGCPASAVIECGDWNAVAGDCGLRKTRLADSMMYAVNNLAV